MKRGQKFFAETTNIRNIRDFGHEPAGRVGILFISDDHADTDRIDQPVAGDVVDFVHQIDKGKNVFVIGGNSLVGPLLDADLFDHLIIQIAPLILGKGVPLFTQEEGQRDLFLILLFPFYWVLLFS